MRTIPLLCFSIAAVLLLQPSVRADDRSYAFSTVADVAVSSNTTMAADEANQIRGLADANFDGTIDTAEAKRTEDQFRRQAEDSPDTRDLIDNATPISRLFVSATLKGLVGARNSTEPIVAQSVAKLTFRPSETATHEFKRVVTSTTGSTFAVDVPPDMEIKSATGLTNVSQGLRRVSGTFTTENVVVIFGPLTADSPTPTVERRDAPLGAVPLIAVLVAAFVHRHRR